MKRTILSIFCLLLLTVPAIASEQITLAWDSNDPAPDYYRLYQRLDGETYSYDTEFDTTNPLRTQDTTLTVTVVSPVVTPPAPVWVSGSYSRSTGKILLTWNQAEATDSLTYYWIVRAEIPPDQSGDSNEVSHTVSSTSSVVRWDIFYSLTTGGPWTLLSSVENNGQASPTLTDPLTVVEEGDKVDVYFTIVAFSSDTLYSGNAQELMVTVDRRTVVAPTLTIQAVVPVQ